MGNYKLEYGNGNWLTGVGGSVMTATDLDTGIVEPILLKNGRGSEKTAIDKNGKLYTVKPYENAVTYIDGVAKHNTEPLSENRLTYSNDFTNAAWSKTDTTLTANYGISPDGEQNSTLVEFVANAGYMFRNLAYGGSNESSTLWVKGVVGETIYFGRGSNIGAGAGAIYTFSGEWERLEFNNSSDVGAGFYLSTFSGTVNAITFEIYGAQLENQPKATSYIPTNGATATRLADTGITTPDISKYINSREGVFKIKANALANDLTNRIISLSDGTNNNRINFYYRGISNEVLVRTNVNNEGSVDITHTVADTTIEAEYEIRYTSNNVSLYIDDVFIGSQSISGFTQGILKYLKFSSPTNSENFIANTELITIE